MAGITSDRFLNMQVVEQRSILLLPKALKNDAEIEGCYHHRHWARGLSFC